MSTIEQPTRVFRFGSLMLADPDPGLEPIEAVRLYAPNYPQLATAQLMDPLIENDRLVYPVEKPPAKTKG